MSRVSLLLVVQIVFILLNESRCLTMLGLTRGTRSSKEQPLYFPEEDNLPAPNRDELDMTYVRKIGSIAGRELIPRRWNDNESVRRPILNSEGIPVSDLRQQPVVSRVLGRHGGIY